MKKYELNLTFSIIIISPVPDRDWFKRGVGVNASRFLLMEWRQALLNWIVGPSRPFTGVARGRSWKLFKCQCSRQLIRSPYANTIAQTLANPIHATPEKYLIGCCHYVGASAPSFRHALRQALTPTPRVNGHSRRVIRLRSFFFRSAFIETADQTSQSDYRPIVIGSRSIVAPLKFILELIFQMNEQSLLTCCF